MVKALNTPKVRYWLKEGLRFFSWQAFIMLINMITGFIIIRNLPKTDYAYYTIAFATLSMFTNITNTGITPAINSLGGKIWKDKHQMGALVNSALAFRREVTLVFLIPVMAYGIWQLSLNQAAWFTIFILIIAIAPGGWAQIQASIYKTTLQLNGKIHQIQKAETAAALLKLLGISLLLITFFCAPLVIFLASLAFLLNLYFLKKETGEVIEITAPASQDSKRKIFELFKPNIVNTLYWAFQGQITILLCAIFGSTENVAEIGALGRLSILFSVIQLFLNNYILPKIAKAEQPSEILRIFSLVITFNTFLIYVPILFFSWYSPKTILWILGSNYYNLENELPVFTLSILLNVLQGLIYGFCAAKGWINYHFVYTPFTISLQLFLLLILEINTLLDVIIFSGVVNLFTVILQLILFLKGYLSYKKNFNIKHENE